MPLMKSETVIGVTEDILVFGNPISGLGRGLAIAQQVTESAQSAGFNARMYLEHPSSIPDSWIPQDPAGVVVAIGGDGTLRGVVDRLLRSSAAGRPVPQILTVPLGTANLVASHLGCRWKKNQIGAEVLRAIRADKRRKLDVATANGQAMLAVGGVGFDAHVVHGLSARRRGPITYADYFVPTVRSIAGYRFNPLTITVDSQTVLQDTSAIAFVGNIPEYGAGFSVTPTARSDDGELDVCILPCRSWQELFELGCICGTGQQVASERVIYRRAKHVEISSDSPVPVQIDGDESGFTPVTFALLDQQLTFIVPS
jgi:diacylglycerol kinase family enzyme